LHPGQALRSNHAPICLVSILAVSFILLIPGRDFHCNPSRGGVYGLRFERSAAVLNVSFFIFRF